MDPSIPPTSHAGRGALDPMSHLIYVSMFVDALLLRRKHVAARPSARQSNIVQDPHISKEDDIYRDVSEEVVAGRTDDDNGIGLRRCIVVRLEEMASDQERQNSLVITSCFFTALSTVVVIARTFVRTVLIRKPGLDDYFIILALVFTLGYLAEVFVGKANHIGFASSQLSFDNMTNLLKTTLAIEATYYVCISAIKISILCMYLRFAVSRSFNILCICTIAFHALFFIICIGVTLSQCQPLSKQWDLTGTVDGMCINTTAFFYFTSGFNILTDIWILILPIKTLSGILRPRREKIALAIIFGVGAFATITSIIRLHTIYTYTLAKDLFQESILVNVWSMLEINIGIICASVPALKPLFTPRALRDAVNRNKKTGYQYHSQDRSGYNSNKSNNSKSADRENQQAYDLERIGGEHTTKTVGQSMPHSPGSESEESIWRG